MKFSVQQIERLQKKIIFVIYITTRQKIDSFCIIYTYSEGFKKLFKVFCILSILLNSSTPDKSEFLKKKSKSLFQDCLYELLLGGKQLSNSSCLYLFFFSWSEEISETSEKFGEKIVALGPGVDVLAFNWIFIFFAEFSTAKFSFLKS